jgi:hypothetical protein
VRTWELIERGALLAMCGGVAWVGFVLSAVFQSTDTIELISLLRWILRLGAEPMKPQATAGDAKNLAQPQPVRLLHTNAVVPGLPAPVTEIRSEPHDSLSFATYNPAGSLNGECGLLYSPQGFCFRVFFGRYEIDIAVEAQFPLPPQPLGRIR